MSSLVARWNKLDSCGRPQDESTTKNVRVTGPAGVFRGGIACTTISLPRARCSTGAAVAFDSLQPPLAMPKRQIEAATARIKNEGSGNQIWIGKNTGQSSSRLPTNHLISCFTIPHIPFAQPPTSGWIRTWHPSTISPRKNNDEERLAFIRKLITSIDEIVSFVDRRLGWSGAGTYGGILKGSFNISIIVNHGSSEDGVETDGVIIRFPTPGRVYASWRAEKVRNEVMVMEYHREHTTIPLPNVCFWGLEEESPEG